MNLFNYFDIRALLLFAVVLAAGSIVVPRTRLTQELTLTANGQLLVIRLDEISGY